MPLLLGLRFMREKPTKFVCKVGLFRIRIGIIYILILLAGGKECGWFSVFQS